MQKAQNIEVLCFLSAASEEAIVANVFTISKVLHDVPSSHRSPFSSSTARIQFKVIETVELQDWLLSVGAEKLQSAR